MPMLSTRWTPSRRRRVAIVLPTMLAFTVPATTGAAGEADGATVRARAERVAVPGDGWFTTTLDPAAGTHGWELEVSDDRERIVTRGDRVDCTAGGFSASTHYARTRRRLPETDDLAARKAFTIAADIELPADFYDRHESYVRLITTDNYPARMRSTGDRVGAASSDEWRVGFLIYAGDELPRLVSEHENRETLVLWKGVDRLPVGRHGIEIRFTPSRSTNGSYILLLDGEVVGERSSVRTVPTTLASSEVAVTRVGGCLDGAAGQDRRSMTISLRSLTFSARR
jgi:hypothetical protein